MPISRNKLLDEDVERVKASPDSLLKYAPDRALDEDRAAAMAKFMKIDSLPNRRAARIGSRFLRRSFLSCLG